MKITHKVSNYDAVRKAIKDISHKSLKVGWGENQKYEDGTPVAAIAVVQEFGSPSKRIPPRSFMRVAAANQGQNWMKQFAGGAKKILKGDLSIQQVFDGVGTLVVGDIKKAIAAVKSPPLAQSTINARLRGKKVKNIATATKPLVDSGYMLSSVTHEVSDK